MCSGIIYLGKVAKEDQVCDDILILDERVKLLMSHENKCLSLQLLDWLWNTETEAI